MSCLYFSFKSNTVCLSNHILLLLLLEWTYLDDPVLALVLKTSAEYLMFSHHNKQQFHRVEGRSHSLSDQLYNNI